MSDDDAPCSSHFSNRGKIRKKTAEEMKAAEDLLKKLEEESMEQSRKGRKKKGSELPATKICSTEIDETPLSRAAKKRLKKMEADTIEELKRLDEANEKILSATITNEFQNIEERADLPAEESDHDIHLTVNYMSKYQRFKCHKEENFYKLFYNVADFFKLKPNEILLCHKDWNISVDDTPKSLSLTPRDILECLPYKMSEKEERVHGNSLKLRFQSNDSKSKIDIIVHKLDKMQDIMEKYSKRRDIPLNKLEFEFDGEKLSGSETLKDLEMESDSCIDVRVLPKAKESDAEQGVKNIDSDCEILD